MKKLMMIMLLAACSKAGFAQEDSTKQQEGSDTIRVGSIIIVNKGTIVTMFPMKVSITKKATKVISLPTG
jgi:ABC-type Zn uptake system ZnuABC Zn-binding protein ZnuA